MNLNAWFYQVFIVSYSTGILTSGHKKWDFAHKAIGAISQLSPPQITFNSSLQLGKKKRKTLKMLSMVLQPQDNPTFCAELVSLTHSACDPRTSCQSFIQDHFWLFVQNGWTWEQGYGEFWSEISILTYTLRPVETVKAYPQKRYNFIGCIANHAGSLNPTSYNSVV